MNAVAPLRARRFRPDVVVAAVVPRADGRFLFVEERVRGRLVLNQPAGHLEPGESLAEAAVRETREEAAWQVRPEALVAVYQWTQPDGTHCVRFTFAATAVQAIEGARLDEGIVRALWLSREELAGGGFTLRSPLVLRSLDDYLAGQRFPLSAVSYVDGVAHVGR